MTGPLGALERSLRDGPADELGYLPKALDLPVGLADDGPIRTSRLERVVLQRSTRPATATPKWQYPATAAILVIGLAAFGIMSTGGQPGIIAPASGSPPPASPTTASPSPSSSATSSPGASPRSSPGASAATASTLPSAALKIAVTPLTETFVSPRNGYSVSYPAGWTVKPATTSWPPDIFLPTGNPALDELTSPKVAALSVASQRLGVGQTADDWLAAFFQPYQGVKPCSGDQSTWPRLPIGGESGYLDVNGCDEASSKDPSVHYLAFDALAFSGGRVYQFQFNGQVDLADFKALLATVQFDAPKALDPGDPS